MKTRGVEGFKATTLNRVEPSPSKEFSACLFAASISKRLSEILAPGSSL